MKKKFSILMFSLLLAVGWTCNASAQQLADKQLKQWNFTEFLNKGPVEVAKVNGHQNGKLKAPSRTPNTITADVTHVYSWYDAITYDWVDANGNPQNSKITEPATTAEQMAYLLGTTYMNPNIPGIQYTEGWETVHPYPNIGFGWDIPNNARWNYDGGTTTAYDDITITANSTNGNNINYTRIYSISVVSGNTTISSWSYNVDGSTLPQGWTMVQAWSLDNYGYIYTNSSSNPITIPGSLLTGYNNVQVVIVARDNNYYTAGYRQVGVNGEYQNLTSNNDRTYTWNLQGHSIKTVTKPYENGYTVFLVKVKDDATKEPYWVYTWDDLIDYFDTHIDEVQLLTDGTRLNEGTEDAGTMFAYSGELNRFYFASKGKMFYLPDDDCAPTNSMYEEFSAHQPVDGGADVTDFYSKLLYGNSYNVIHDCQGVNALAHYFSMSGTDGTDHRSMTNLIFWIPDNRGVSGTRTYDEEFLPHVGLYTITLEATAVPSQTEEGYYDVTCEWVSSLNSILDFPVDQDYELWIYVYDEDGNPVEERMVTNDLHNTTTYTYPEPQKPDDSYTIVYRVYGWPTAATNNRARGGDFYAKSNLDPVIIPGYNDFLALGFNHYESDFAIDKQLNYYRNFLTVDNINEENALTPKRIEEGEDLFSLFRFDATKQNPELTKAAELKFSVSNNEVNYNITYFNQSYVDEAHIYNEASNSELSGYTDPDALGFPTYGKIATISEGGGLPTITRTWDFETDQSSEFILLDNDGDGRNWYYQNSAGTEYTYKTHSGTGLMTSASWLSGSALTPNNWMISPEVTLGGILKLWACGQDVDDNNEVFGVYVYQGTYSSGTSGFVQIGSDITTTGTMTEYTFDLSAYSGKGRFAIVHHNCTDQFRLNIDDISITNQPGESGGSGFELLNDFLDNSTYTQVGQVVFEEPWKSIQVKLQDSSAGTSAGYFLIQSNGKLRFIMPAGYNNASLRFVIRNAPLSSNYHDGTFTLSSTTGETKTINFVTTEGNVDREAIFTGISTGDVITITGTHTVVNNDNTSTLYYYSPDFQYIHVYVEGGHDGISENTALNLAGIQFVDQFKAETDKDMHPYRYGYVLMQGEGEDAQESAMPEVPVQHTGATLAGYYTLRELDNDTHIGINHKEGITLNVMNAQVDMKLTSNPQVYYYTLDRKPSTEPDADYLEISKLQKRENDTYQELDNILDDYQNVFNPVTTPRFDNYDVQTGDYNKYMNYVPIVWTHGEQQDNRRIKWDTEKRHNSYGAPIWKTGVGKTVLESATAEKQQGWNTTWKDGNTECRLYMLDKIVAKGYLPTVSNVEYEPYMFRIFVESNNGNLRKFKYVTDENGNKVIAADETTLDEQKEPLCVWSGYVNDPMNDDKGVQISVLDEGDGSPVEITFHKDKVNRNKATEDDPTPAWDKDKENAIFGVVDDIVKPNGQGQDVIDPDDLTIFVRFYYIVKGMSQGWTPWNPNPGRNAGGDDPAGYGTESDGFTPGPATAVNEMHYVGEIVSQTYYNVQGMTSDKPFDGVNIVVTRYSNGTTSVSKVVK